VKKGFVRKEIRRNRFPAGWDEDRVRSVLEHYEQQIENEAVAEDEAAFRLPGQTVIVLPRRRARNKSLVGGAREG
jgi:hypothetical protein